MKVKEAAEYLTLATNQECTSKMMIDQLRSKYPGQKWTEESELPEEFVQSIEENTKKYQKSESGKTGKKQDSPQITKADPKNALEAIEELKTTNDAIEYGILEALLTSHLEVAIARGIENAFNIVGMYEDATQQTLEAILKSKIQGNREAASTIRDRTEKNLLNRVKARQKRLDHVTKTEESSTEGEEEAKDYLQTIVTAIAPLPPQSKS